MKTDKSLTKNIILSVLSVGILVFIADFLWLLPFGITTVFALMLVASAVLALFLKVSGKRIPSTVILAFGSVVFGVCVFEAVFRAVILKPYIPTNEAQFEALISSGWPEPVPVDRKDPDQKRMIGLADSFGRAGGHENYNFLVGELANKGGRKLEVVNLSRGAYELEDELLLFQRFGPRYQPDVVLHAFFVGNDFMLPAGVYLDYGGVHVRAKTGIRAYSWSHISSLA